MSCLIFLGPVFAVVLYLFFLTQLVFFTHSPFWPTSVSISVLPAWISCAAKLFTHFLLEVIGSRVPHPSLHIHCQEGPPPAAEAAGRRLFPFARCLTSQTVVTGPPRPLHPCIFLCNLASQAFHTVSRTYQALKGEADRWATFQRRSRREIGCNDNFA